MKPKECFCLVLLLISIWTLLRKNTFAMRQLELIITHNTTYMFSFEWHSSPSERKHFSLFSSFPSFLLLLLLLLIQMGQINLLMACFLESFISQSHTNQCVHYYYRCMWVSYFRLFIQRWNFIQIFVYSSF